MEETDLIVIPYRSIMGVEENSTKGEVTVFLRQDSVTNEVVYTKEQIKKVVLDNGMFQFISFSEYLDASKGAMKKYNEKDLEPTKK